MNVLIRIQTPYFASKIRLKMRNNLLARSLTLPAERKELHLAEQHFVVIIIDLCVFQQVHAFTSDLKVASVSFEAMLRGLLPLPGPIRIKHIEPHIFKMLIE